MAKVPSRYMRLRENHPTMVKLEKLFAFADELGISIAFNSNGPAHLYDKDFVDGEAPLIISDIDSPGASMDSFPCTLDFKITYENPAYLVYLGEQERDRLAEIERRRLEAEKRVAELKARGAEKKAKEKEARRVKRITSLKTRLQKDQEELKRLQQLTE